MNFLLHTLRSQCKYRVTHKGRKSESSLKYHSLMVTLYVSIAYKLLRYLYIEALNLPKIENVLSIKLENILC